MWWRTADELNAEQRAALAKVQTVLSAGAPIPVPLLEALSALVPNASLHTPLRYDRGSAGDRCVFRDDSPGDC